MNTTDPIFEALDRLADVVDTRPAHDPMPGILSKARANRRRANALVAGGLVAVVGAGFGLWSAVDVFNAASSPGYSGTPSTSPTAAPTTPPPSPDPDPDTSTPPPAEPTLAEYDRARADVDGDGAADTIRIRIPEADAAQGQNVILDDVDVQLQVELATGATVELALGKTIAPTISGTPDLDENDDAEIVLGFSGGDAGWIKVFTWDGDTVVRAEPAPSSPTVLVDDGDLHVSTAGPVSVLLDSGLVSWISTDDPSVPGELRFWTWRLDGQQLVADEEEQPYCMGGPGQYPEPC